MTYYKMVDGEKIELTEAEVQAFLAKPSNDDDVAKGLRRDRNMFLAETDHWVVADRTPTQEQLDYRQALRDVPQQEGWPHYAVWPTKPE